MIIVCFVTDVGIYLPPELTINGHKRTGTPQSGNYSTVVIKVLK